jgi:addiction module HigA family antidote
MEHAMEMKNPLHPGLVIRENLEDLGMPVVEAAKGLGISRQQLHNLIAGRSAIGPEVAVRLEMALGSSADNWLRMQAAHDLAEIRRSTPPIEVKRFDATG